MRSIAVRAAVGLALVALVIALAAVARHQRHTRSSALGHCSLRDGGTCRVACEHHEGGRLYARLLVPGLSAVQAASTIRARGPDGAEARVESDHGVALARCEGVSSVEFFLR